MAPGPPSCPLRYQLSHMGQLLAKKPLTGVRFSVATEKYSFRRLVMQSCDQTKSADDCEAAFFPLLLLFFLLMRWLSALLKRLLLVSQDKLRNGERFLSGSRDSEQL